MRVNNAILSIVALCSATILAKPVSKNGGAAPRPAAISVVQPAPVVAPVLPAPVVNNNKPVKPAKVPVPAPVIPAPAPVVPVVPVVIPAPAPAPAPAPVPIVTNKKPALIKKPLKISNNVPAAAPLGIALTVFFSIIILTPHHRAPFLFASQASVHLPPSHSDSSKVFQKLT